MIRLKDILLAADGILFLKKGMHQNEHSPNVIGVGVNGRDVREKTIPTVSRGTERWSKRMRKAI